MVKTQKREYRVMPVYSNEIANEVFNIDKFQDLIKETNKSLVEIARILGIKTNSLRRFMKDEAFPMASTYKKIYTNFHKIYEDKKDKKFDKFYFSKIQKLDHLNLQQLLYICGYTANSMRNKLQRKKLEPSKFDALLFSNSASLVYDEDSILLFLNKIFDKIGNKIDPKVGIEYKLLEAVFFRYRNSPNKVKSGVQSISQMSINRIKKDIDKYIIEHNNKNEEKITIRNLHEIIFNKTDIQISEYSMYRLYRTNTESTTTNSRVISPKTFVALRNFFHSGLVEDYKEGKNKDLLLAYTTYNSLEEMSLSELIFVSGYTTTDIVPRDTINNDGEKIGHVEHNQFMTFLSVGGRRVLSTEDREKFFIAIANILKDQDITDKVVEKSYENTRIYIENTNKDKYLLRKKRMLEAESKEKSKDKGKDIQIDIPKQSKKRKLVDYSSESEFVSSESENESMGEQLASLDIGESSSRRLTRSRSLSTRNSVVHGRQLSNIEASSDFTEQDIEDIYSSPVLQWTNKKSRTDIFWYKRKTSEEELSKWDWNVNNTEHVTKRRRG